MYTVYFIEHHPIKNKPYVGCTHNLEGRIINHQVLLNEVIVLIKTEEGDFASYGERFWQKIIFGKADKYPYTYHKSKKENRTGVYYTNLLKEKL